MRRAGIVLAAAIPRDAWDPLRHHPKHVDSYAQHLVDRRQWPAKKWSVGIEPRTPREWLKFSLRNLAYAYNGALRACSSFPEMVPLYQEMKQRKVKVDVDTMVTMLSRAARFEKIRTIEIFMLFDEMCELGAKPDLVVIEILHTAWDNSVTLTPLEREARRVQLLELYDTIAKNDISTLGPKNVPNLLQTNIARLRENMEGLGGTFSPETWKMYFAQIRGFDFLLLEVNNYLWSLTRGKKIGSTEIGALQIEVPHLDEVLRRPQVGGASGAAAAAPSSTDGQWDDAVVNDVVLSAVERLVDWPLTANIPPRSQLFALVSVLWKSRLLLAAPLLEQIMDIVKYSGDEKFRNRDAQTFFRYAFRATSNISSNELRQRWIDEARPISAALVGRYLAARDPWSVEKFSLGGGGRFEPFPAAQLTTATSSTIDGSAEVPNDGSGSSILAVRSAADVDARVQDIDALIAKTGVLTEARLATEADRERSVEVFTGKLSVLRRMLTGEPYTAPEEEQNGGPFAVNAPPVSQLQSQKGAASSAARQLFSVEVAAKIFAAARATKYEMDVHVETHRVQPELEAWESLMLISSFTLDQLAASKRSQTEQGRMQADALFAEVAEFRAQLVEESKTRFGGRFRMLWLQEC